jgi:DNA-binding protein YbaB
MPRKQDIPRATLEVLEELHLRLRSCPNQPIEVKIAWYKEAKSKVGDRGARVALMLYEANIPLNQVVQNYPGVSEMTQQNNPGGQSITQKAGGDMVGVNAAGTQTIRDIAIYKQDLDQTGASISAPVRAALVEARESIESADLDAALKPVLIEQFDKMTEELKKGDKKNPGLLKGLWAMIYGAITSVPAAVSCVVALDKLRHLLGY